ncbi:hypothetical protein RHGRI_034138 [Rhododendron griersonianum]|uniref:Endonuclease/exonuclease/phosphatase domain-containing protein n=1 Tax=Rhododendron griersonianum TaxID=479676 RepID=A0AAV6HZV0_9ERIC|nr:hypothetical protein RHGRI_034138 [Rhododendron griersonianum]
MDSAIRVDPTGLAGGLAIFWKGTTTVTLEKMCSWFIDVRIFDVALNKSWRLVNVYFSPNDAVRRTQWDFFMRYKSCLGDDWVLWGDMNDILCSEEKKGGIFRPAWSLKGFQNFVNDCGLVDLGFSGYPFTWRNNRSGNNYVQERLDRVLATPSWCLLFAQASVTHLDTVGSDHNALHLKLRDHVRGFRVPFRFDARWVEDEDARNVVNQAWATPVQGSKSFMVYKKIQACRSSLTNWKRRKRDNSGKSIADLKTKIFALSNSWPGPPLEIIKDLKWQLKKEWDKEEVFWKQKSRVTWLKNGDKNTKFFHASVMQRRAGNRISGIEVANGNWTSDPQEVQAEFQHFFAGLFTAGPSLQMRDTVEVIPHKITDAMNHSLVIEETAKMDILLEVKRGDKDAKIRCTRTMKIPGKSRVVEFGNMQTIGMSILVHTIIYFGLITIFPIAIGVHIYTG